VAVDFLLADVEAGGGAPAQGYAAADALVLAAEGMDILQAFDGQVAADVRDHLLATGHSATQRGGAAGLPAPAVTRRALGMRPGDVLAVAVAPRGAGVGGESIAGAVGADIDRHPGPHAGAAALALYLAAVARGQQGDVALGLEQHVAAGGDGAAADRQVRILPGAAGHDAHITTGTHRGAGGRIAARFGTAVALAGAGGDGDVQASACRRRSSVRLDACFIWSAVCSAEITGEETAAVTPDWRNLLS